MSIMHGTKKQISFLFLLVAVQTYGLHALCYVDYAKAVAPYGLALAFAATNYAQRTYHSSSYDNKLSYWLPAVAISAYALYNQPSNWRTALLKSVPAMIIALGAMGVEKIQTPDVSKTTRDPSPAPPLVNEQQPYLLHQTKEPENVHASINAFLAEKTHFEDTYKIYKKHAQIVQNSIDNLFTNGTLDIFTNMVTDYNKLITFYTSLQQTYKQLQKLASPTLKSPNTKEYISVTNTTMKDVDTKMQHIADPEMVIATQVYIDQIIQKYYRFLHGAVEINEQLVHKFMQDVPGIEAFFSLSKLNVPFNKDISTLTTKIITPVTDSLEKYKQFDLQTSKHVDTFLRRLKRLNKYLTQSKKEMFNEHFESIADTLANLGNWYNKHTATIQTMSAMVARSNGSLGQNNVYEDLIQIIQLPWQGYIIALLQNHYITRMGGKKEFPTYLHVLSQAYKDVFFNHMYYHQLAAFARNLMANDALQNKVITWWNILP